MTLFKFPCKIVVMYKMFRKFSFFVFFSFFLFSASARVVKVGYISDSGKFMSGSSSKDAKRGYAYEYLQKISSYSGWTYEYVYGSWAELYRMLLNGDIDLLPDVSYTKDRESELFFPRFPMGRENYYLYENNREFSYGGDVVSYLDGKSLCVSEGTYQFELIKRWIADNKVNLNISVYPSYSDDSLKERFNSGNLDLYLSIDSVALSNWEPVAKIGESDIYLTVSKSSPEILAELNKAMDELYFTYPYYNEQLWLSYFGKNLSSKRISEETAEWLKEKNTIKIGCRKDEFPFSMYNPRSEKVEGLLVMLMNQLTLNFNLHNLNIEYVMFDSSSEMRSALSYGQIDAAFPVYDSYNELEKDNLLITTPFTDVDLVYVNKDYSNYTVMQNVAVEDSDYIYSFIQQKYPETVMGFFQSSEDCLTAVTKGLADGAVMPYHKFDSISYHDKKYKRLNCMEIPVKCGVSFAVNKKNIQFLAVLNRLQSSLSDSEINTMLTRYTMEARKYDFRHFISENAALLILLLIFFVCILILLMRSLSRIKKYINYDVL